MARLEDLVIHLRGEVSGLKNALRDAQKDLKDFAQKTNSQLDQIDQKNKKVAASFGQLGSLVKTYIGIQTVKAIGDAAIKMQALQARMQAAMGDTQIAGDSLAYVRAEAERLGLYFPTAADAFAGFAASALRSGITLDETKEIFKGVSEAAAAMKLSVADQGLVFKALEQMAAKGVVSMEELRGQLGERMSGAVALFAQSMGVTQQKFLEMVGNGEVGTRALIGFGRALSQEFGGAAVDAADSAQASINRFNNALFDMNNKLAETGAIDLFTDALKLLAEVMSSEVVDKGISVMSHAINGLRISIEATAAAATWLGDTMDRIGEVANKPWTLLLGGKEASVGSSWSAYQAKLAEIEGRLGGGKTVGSSGSLGRGLPTGGGGVTIDKEAAKEAEKHAKAISKVVDELRFRNEQMARTNDDQELYNQLRAAGVSIDSEAGKQIEKLVGTYNKLHNAQEEEKEKLERQKDLVRDLGLTFSSAFEDAIVKGEGLRGVLKGIFDDLSRLVVRKGITEPLFASISEAFTGGGKKSSGNGIISGISSFFGGLFGRASGGAVSPQTPYMVGERGPELFVPNVGGTVMNKNQVGGSGQSVIVNQTLNISAGVAQTVRAEITRMMPELREMSVQAVQNATSRGAMTV